uniref:Uncharacterized protein n=1 Tax=Amphimedon queenslandica TaxID=400682 RepID=A0A1X7TDQ6_AMPQE
VLLNNELIQQYRDGLQNWIIAIKKKRCVIHKLMIRSFYKHDIGNTMRNQEERNPSLPAQYENVEMITGTNANVNNIPTNDCSAYGVVIQRH